MILKLAAVCGLIIAASCYDRDDASEELERPSYSWKEAKGYKECKQFTIWKNKDRDSEDFNTITDNDVDWEQDENQERFRGAIEQNINFNPRSKRHHGRPENKARPENKGRPGPHPSRKSKWHHPKPLSEICYGYTELQCPPYETLANAISGCGFETRRIGPANWTLTPVDISDFQIGFKAAYMRLHNYISGANELGVKIAMTAPVITQMFLDDDYRPTSAYMGLVVPTEHQAAPPAATDPYVGMAWWSTPVTTYNRAFGGKASQSKVERSLTYLFKALKKERIAFNSKVVFVAEYTNPGDKVQRHEVMYPAPHEHM